MQRPSYGLGTHQRFRDYGALPPRQGVQERVCGQEDSSQVQELSVQEGVLEAETRYYEVLGECTHQAIQKGLFEDEE